MIKKVIALVISVILFGHMCMAKDSRTLVAYFSAEGHTKAVAEEIAKQTAADLFVIEPAKPYALNPYDDTELIKREAYNDMRPAVKRLLPKERVERYDTIYVGSPLWWHQPAMVVCTFLENYDLFGKVVIPFMTFGSRSYLNEGMQKLYKSTPNSIHIPSMLPYDISPEDIQHPQDDDAGIDMPENADEVKVWLDRIHKKGLAGVPYLKFQNGAEMPQFGLGTFAQGNDSICESSVLAALAAGYRHIDTAHSYGIERGVGRAISKSGVPREEIWVTSKLYPFEMGTGKTTEAIDKMLSRLGLDYVDLLYVHHPFGDFKGGWKEMEQAVRDGKVRNLGISNFDYPEASADFEYMCDSTDIRPQILQIECHPYAQRLDMRRRAAEKNILVESWFPLGGAMSNGALLKDPVICSIAEAHGVTPAQVIIRWHLQEGLSVIPGATNHDYIKENIASMNFELSSDDMNKIRRIDKETCFFPHNYQNMKAVQENKVLPD